jgi:hypothetical protein
MDFLLLYLEWLWAQTNLMFCGCQGLFLQALKLAIELDVVSLDIGVPPLLDIVDNMAEGF